MSTKLLFSPIFWLLCLCPLSRAAVFYVDNSGSSACSNSPANGSAAAPWCTINYGVGRLSSGDTLNVKAGTYHEDVYISGPAGTTGKPTTIQAYLGQTVTILGDGIDSGRVKIANTSYITFTGFTITNFNQGIFVESSDHIVVQNCSVHDIGQEGIHIHYGSSFVTVSQCTIHDTGKWIYDGEGIYIGTSDSAPLDNTNNVIISKSTIYNTTDEAIEFKIGTHNVTADGNTIYNANSANNGYGGAAIEVNQAVGSVQHWGSNPNHIVKNNIIHDVGPGTSGSSFLNSAIRAGTGVTVSNNLIYSLRGTGATAGYGVMVDNQSSDSYTRFIYHNTIDTSAANAVNNSGGAQDVRNNIGPTGPNNVAVNNSYFVSEAARNYHLVGGSAPINAGVDLTSVVSTDIEGISRLTSPPPDLGAYEYVAGSHPAPPTNLTGVVR